MISMCFGANVDSLEVAALEIPEVFDGQHVDQLPVSVMSRGEEVAPHPDGNRAERVTPAERCRWVEPKSLDVHPNRFSEVAARREHIPASAWGVAHAS